LVNPVTWTFPGPADVRRESLDRSGSGWRWARIGVGSAMVLREGIAIVLIVAAVAGCLMPARRATTVSPMTALRAEV